MPQCPLLRALFVIHIVIVKLLAKYLQRLIRAAQSDVDSLYAIVLSIFDCVENIFWQGA